MTAALRQLRALGTMMFRGVVNSLRRRQGAGAMVVFPLLVAVLAIELARFGGRGADGVRRVFETRGDAAGIAFASRWLSVMAVAVLALKHARAIPGRGSRPLFDTVLFRALPVSALTRTGFELAAGLLHAAGFVVLAFAPAFHGVVTQRFSGATALALTAAFAATLDVVTTLAAHALHAVSSRYAGGRALDWMRVLSGATGVLLAGLFAAAGPIGAAVARPGAFHRVSTRTGLLDFLHAPVMAIVMADPHTALRSAGGALAIAAGSIAVLAWRVRAPIDLSLDAPRDDAGTSAWRSGFAGWRVELRMLLRQAPYMVLATPAFLAFFVAVVAGAPHATGRDLPLVTLTGLVGWSLVVQGTALTGAASRRWRRVLWLVSAAGSDHRAPVRAVARAHFVLTALLAVTALLPWRFAEAPLWWWYPREAAGIVVAIAVGQWAQSAALFLWIDPSPDRLTGLSVAGVFAVLATSFPTAGLIVLLSATPLATWLSLVALLAFFAWAMERAAAERLRWLRDPAGDVDADRRVFPALRAFGIAALAQVLVAETGDAAGWSPPVRLTAALAVFTGALLPMAIRGAREHPRTARWSASRAVAVGASAGAAYFLLAAGYARIAMRFGAAPSPLAHAVANAHGPVLWIFAAAAVTVIPLCEETFFRGWLFPALRRETGSVRIGAIGSAAVFALVHAGASWAPAFGGGLLASLLLLRSGRLRTGIAMHAVHNALVLAVALHGH